MVDGTVCKFWCESVTHLQASPTEINQKVSLRTAYDPQLDEDRRFSKATPSGEMSFLVHNPNLNGFFKPGEKYLITITPVEKDA